MPHRRTLAAPLGTLLRVNVDDMHRGGITISKGGMECLDSMAHDLGSRLAATTLQFTDRSARKRISLDDVTAACKLLLTDFPEHSGMGRSATAFMDATTRMWGTKEKGATRWKVKDKMHRSRAGLRAVHAKRFFRDRSISLQAKEQFAAFVNHAMDGVMCVMYDVLPKGCSRMMPRHLVDATNAYRRHCSARVAPTEAMRAMLEMNNMFAGTDGRTAELEMSIEEVLALFPGFTAHISKKKKASKKKASKKKASASRRVDPLC